MAQMEAQQQSLAAVLAIQILTLIFQFVQSIIQQIGKNRLEQIHAQNEYANKKIDEIHKQSSEKGSNDNIK